MEPEDDRHDGDQVGRVAGDEGRRAGLMGRARQVRSCAITLGAGDASAPSDRSRLWTAARARPRCGRKPVVGRGGGVGAAWHDHRGALRADDPARGSRRLLRRGGAARQALAARQAGRRRRGRRPRRRGDGVVRGAHLRGALGDAHRGGPPALPERRVPLRPVPRLPRHQPRGDGAAALDQPAGRAAVARRGVRRPRGRRPPRPLASPSVSALARDLKDRVHEVTGGITGLGRHRHLQAHRQDRQRPRQARRARRRRSRDGAGPAAPDAGDGHPGCRPGDRRAAAPGRRAHRRGARAAHRGRAGPAARPGPRRRPLRPGPGPRTTGRSSPSGRRSRSASRTPTTPTTSTSGCSRRCWTARRPRSPSGCARRGSRDARSRSRCGCTTSPRVSRSATLSEPSDDGRQIARVARTLLGELDTSGGVRLLGVGVSGLADWIQEDLFADEEDERGRHPTRPPRPRSPPPRGTAAGPRAWTSCTRRTAAAGSGARAGAWSRSASRPPRPVRAACSASPVADPALAPFRPPEE